MFYLIWTYYLRSVCSHSYIEELSIRVFIVRYCNLTLISKMIDCWLFVRGLNSITVYFVSLAILLVCISIGCCISMACRDIVIPGLERRMTSSNRNSDRRTLLRRSQILALRYQSQNQVSQKATSVVQFSARTETVTIVPIAVK